MSRWRVFKEQFFPSAGTLMLLAGAAGLLVIGASCSIVFALSSPDVEDPASVGILLGLFVVPVVALIIIISAIREKRPGPRAVLWFLVGALIVLAGLILAIALSFEPELGLGASGFFFLAFCAPAALVMFLPAVYFAIKAQPTYREALEKARNEHILATIEARGTLRLAELARAMATTETVVRARLDELVGKGLFKGTIYDRQGMIFAPGHVQRKRSQLVAVVHAQGQVHIEDLAHDMDTPVSILQEWIYYLVERGRFTGHINWQEGLLYSAEAQQLREGNKCPQCKGEMSLAGKGVVQCPYCGTEVFL